MNHLLTNTFTNESVVKPLFYYRRIYM